jgi:hypothetical protein
MKALCAGIREDIIFPHSAALHVGYISSFTKYTLSLDGGGWDKKRYRQMLKK